MSIEGKYFFFSTDDYYTFGQILTSLGEGFFLAYKTGCEKPYECVYHLAQLTDGNEGRTCQFFNTEIELQDYIKWIEEPSDKTNVVKLVKKHDDKL